MRLCVKHCFRHSRSEQAKESGVFPHRTRRFKGKMNPATTTTSEPQATGPSSLAPYAGTPYGVSPEAPLSFRFTPRGQVPAQVSRRQIAEYQGVTVQGVAAWERKGLLRRANKFGDARYWREDVWDFFLDRRQPTRPEKCTIRRV